VRRRVNRTTLSCLREMPSEEVLSLLAAYVKADPTYVPVKDPRSRRWHVTTASGDFEILTTGPKWWDTRARKGGGGAIDLTVHLLQMSFVDAVKLLTERARPRG